MESEFSQLWGMESGWCRLHICQPFSQHNYWSCGSKSSVAVAHEGYLVQSRRPLQFGSSQANLQYTEHSPLAAVSRTMLIISLCLASRVSLSSPFFKSLFRWFSLFSKKVQYVKLEFMERCTYIHNNTKKISTFTASVGLTHACPN